MTAKARARARHNVWQQFNDALMRKAYDDTLHERFSPAPGTGKRARRKMARVVWKHKPSCLFSDNTKFKIVCGANTAGRWDWSGISKDRVMWGQAPTLHGARIMAAMTVRKTRRER